MCLRAIVRKIIHISYHDELNIFVILKIYILMNISKKLLIYIILLLV